MASARYWRIIGIEVFSGGYLELSEIALYEGAARVDGSAMVASTIAPVSGSLASIGDADFETTARWSGDAVRRPGFSLVFDFGSGVTKDVSAVGLAGPTLANFAHCLSVQYSSDGAAWSDLFANARTKHPGAGAIFKVDTAELPDYFGASVSALLPMDGANNGTTFTDVAGKTVTRAGSVVTSTAQVKYGTASAYFPGGASSHLVVSDPGMTFAVGVKNFTIEAWLYHVATNGSAALCCTSDGRLRIVNDDNRWVLQINGGSYNVFVLNSALPIGAWYHIAVVRNGSSIYLYIDGAQAGSGTSAEVTGHTNTTLLIGAHDSDSKYYLNGYMDDFMFTLGVARYTEAFTPPARLSRVFPDRTPTRTPLLGAGPDVFEDVGGSANVYLSRALPQLDVYDAGRGRIVGTVKEKGSPSNIPLKRRVVLLSMPGSRAMRETWSDPASGVYEFREIAMDRRYTVISYDHTGVYRGVVADNLSPELMT